MPVLGNQPFFYGMSIAERRAIPASRRGPSVHKIVVVIVVTLIAISPFMSWPHAAKVQAANPQIIR